MVREPSAVQGSGAVQGSSVVQGSGAVQGSSTVQGSGAVQGSGVVQGSAGTRHKLQPGGGGRGTGAEETDGEDGPGRSRCRPPGCLRPASFTPPSTPQCPDVAPAAGRELSTPFAPVPPVFAGPLLGAGKAPPPCFLDGDGYKAPALPVLGCAGPEALGGSYQCRLQALSFRVNEPRGAALEQLLGAPRPPPCAAGGARAAEPKEPWPGGAGPLQGAGGYPLGLPPCLYRSPPGMFFFE
nr:forkhead box protein S1 [Dromaius novaehollandiae]